MSEPKIETKPKPDAAPPPEKPERFIPASESRFMTSAEYKAPIVYYQPESDTPFEHLLRPEYWANIKRLHTNVHIYVDAEDGSYWAELKVLKVGQGYAQVMVFRHVVLAAPGPDPMTPDGYEIQFRGPIVKHRVLRLKDGHVLKQALDSEEDARDWLRDYKKMLAN
jgi:hypothetical protein